MSSVNIPNPPPPPQSPVEDDEAKRARQAAEDAATAEAKATGRGSTIVGGGVLAREKQYQRAVSRRSRAADDLSG